MTLWVSHEEMNSPTLSTRPRRSRTVAWQCSPSLDSLHSMLPQVCTAAIASFASCNISYSSGLIVNFLLVVSSCTEVFAARTFVLTAHCCTEYQTTVPLHCTWYCLMATDSRQLGHGFAASARHIRHSVSGSAAGADCEICSCRSCCIQT